MSGKVVLVGAGPGDPELMTVKAVGALERADLVLYDELVSQAILARIPAATRAVSVGKRAGHEGPAQEEIHRRMIAGARAGLTVVRLKGGDPLVFGRGGEEIEALREAGIEFEIVPGVTAALAAAAAARIPLTDRRLASKLVFLSAHRAGEWSLDEWRSAASGESTLVVYMPGENYVDLAAELLAGGMDEDTPVALVANASRPNESIRTTTLADLPELGRLPSPAVLLIGAVAAFHQWETAGERFEQENVEAT
ncbi:MAG TPA: uroporphyrinogen-III C-methyltransferase [Candidatus Acidoferrales bacterium]|nr:uroporphyrinogen-III C-methyltransferase [Candidatus Acidoferrales bacterium]